MNKNLPNSQNNTSGVVIPREVSQSFSGPLPHLICCVDQCIIPGSAERIIKMAESNQHTERKKRKLSILTLLDQNGDKFSVLLLPLQDSAFRLSLLFMATLWLAVFIGVGTCFTCWSFYCMAQNTRHKKERTKKI